MANANGSGYASFGFEVEDDGGTANGGVDRDPDEKTLTIDVVAMNDAPVAVDDTVTTPEDTGLTIPVLGNETDVENDTLTPSLVTGPANGSVTLNSDGTFAYTPDPDFNGADSFTYGVNDGELDGGKLRVIASIEEQATIERILEHLGGDGESVDPAHPSRGPPKRDLLF